MVIFTSVFLLKSFSVDTDKVGYIMAIALTAYIFITIPIGILADRKYGEKEMLIIGFIITAVSTLWFALNENSSIYVLAGLIFLTRVGAAFVQTMGETYFFKHIDGQDANLIAAFRALYPFSSLIAPIVVAPVLFVYSYRGVFAALSIIVLFGVYFAMRIKDTK